MASDRQHSWTAVQANRLKELGAGSRELDARFDQAGERDQAFQKLVKRLVKSHRARLEHLRTKKFRPGICELESRLVEAMVAQGFVQVTTPIIMSRGLLARMTVDENHDLGSQVYWLDKSKCLRPMLAPHLYFVLKDLLRLWERPVRIFEVGPCFRKESQGARHASEFTMLNLVEMGMPATERQARLKQLAAVIMKAAGIDGYAFESETSDVYGETLDVVAGDGVEVGSGAMGPHALDEAWRISENWVGIGFGLERLLMVVEGSRNLGSVGRSITCLDGVRLNI
ncbi:MAG: pyrrolysine--tRNA(Pyl) ligase large subunit [Deltaproteobacteria bacterium]|nr:pyrrolysine--tRNA(Pyl) ligase large subunit [Deltaproteobacteria bacterium]